MWFWSGLVKSEPDGSRYSLHCHAAHALFDFLLFGLRDQPTAHSAIFPSFLTASLAWWMTMTLVMGNLSEWDWKGRRDDSTYDAIET
jgi:hypothetical protein